MKVIMDDDDDDTKLGNCAYVPAIIWTFQLPTKFTISCLHTDVMLHNHTDW
jgi:hypothetical protein